MENYTLQEDLRLLYVTAKTFPEGIDAAFEELKERLPHCDRPFYGFSKPNEKGEIVYKAAALEKTIGEGELSGLATFIVPKGKYGTETIHHFKHNTALFSKCFDRLLTTPLLDPTTYCVEWYKSGEEVICMVKLKD